MNFYPSSLTKIPSVSELTQSIKDVLEDNFTMITVQGEVSQPLVSSNGHLYFTLKDDAAQISCVMWRATRMKTQTQLVQGQQITAFGSVKVYESSDVPIQNYMKPSNKANFATFSTRDKWENLLY